MTASMEREAAPAVAARRRGTVGRVLLAAVAVLAAAAVLLPVAAGVSVLLASRSDDLTRTDAVVVLGASQFWGRPSPVLQSRLAHGRDLYEQGVAPRVVTVGGKQPGDRTTEAQAGREWLTAHGVPGDDALALPEGSDTLQSLTAVAALMARHGWTSATLVTDPAHEARSMAIARALGIDAHAAPTRTGAGSAVTLDYLARESAGLAWFWVDERRRVAGVVGR